MTPTEHAGCNCLLGRAGLLGASTLHVSYLNFRRRARLVGGSCIHRLHSAQFVKGTPDFRHTVSRYSLAHLGTNIAVVVILRGMPEAEAGSEPAPARLPLRWSSHAAKSAHRGRLA